VSSSGRFGRYRQVWNTAQRLGIAGLGIGGALFLFYLPEIKGRFVGDVAKKTSELLDDEDIKANTKKVAVKVLNHILYDENNKEAVADLVRDVIRQPTTYVSLRDLIVWLLRQDWIIKETEDIAAWNTHEILDDPWIRNWLEKTVLGILMEFLSHEEFIALLNSQAKKDAAAETKRDAAEAQSRSEKTGGRDDSSSSAATANSNKNASNPPTDQYRDDDES